jgi:FkbM family methyltransferase
MTLLIKRAMAIALILFSLVLVVQLSIEFHPPLFPLGLNLIGKDSLCTAAEAYQGAGTHLSVIEDGAEETFGIEPIRSESGLQLVGTSVGDWWVPEGGEQFLPDLLSQQENGLYGIGERGVQPGDVVLDCGAHIGLFTRKALEMGASTVVAIEISPPNIECLKRNFEQELKSRRVIIYPKGVWNKDDFLTLYTSENSAGDSVVLTQHRSAVETRVPLTTIDKLVSELELSKVDFVKMDIKGAAAKALEGAQKTLRSYRPSLAIATEEDSDHPDLIAKTMSDLELGYDTLCGACTAKPNSFSWRDLVNAMRGYKVYPLVLFFSPLESSYGETSRVSLFARTANQ